VLWPSGLAALSIAARLLLPFTPLSNQFCIVARTPVPLPVKPKGTGCAALRFTFASGLTCTLCKLPAACVFTKAQSCALVIAVPVFCSVTTFTGAGATGFAFFAFAWFLFSAILIPLYWFLAVTVIGYPYFIAHLNK